MLGRSVIVDTPWGKLEVPAWAECYCVTRHKPMYLYPLPYVMPDGNTLYMCPNAHHQVTTLFGFYQKLKGQPSRDILKGFTVFAQRTAKICWQLILEKEVQDAVRRRESDRSAEEQLRTAASVTREVRPAEADSTPGTVPAGPAL